MADGNWPYAAAGASTGADPVRGAARPQRGPWWGNVPSERADALCSASAGPARQRPWSGGLRCLLPGVRRERATVGMGSDSAGRRRPSWGIFDEPGWGTSLMLLLIIAAVLVFVVMSVLDSPRRRSRRTAAPRRRRARPRPGRHSGVGRSGCDGRIERIPGRGEPGPGGHARAVAGQHPIAHAKADAVAHAEADAIPHAEDHAIPHAEDHAVPHAPGDAVACADGHPDPVAEPCRPRSPPRSRS